MEKNCLEQLASDVENLVNNQRFQSLEEDNDYLSGQLSTASAIIDAKDEELDKKNKIINSLEKEVKVLKDKLLNAYEEIISLNKAL